MEIIRKIFNFIFTIIYCLLTLSILIWGIAVFSRFLVGSLDSDSFFQDIWYIFKTICVKEYKFHFSNLTVFFILLSSRYIKKFFRLWQYKYVIALFLINTLYVVISFYVFYGFRYALGANRLNVEDLVIVISNVLLSQVSSLYFHVGRKRLMQSVYGCEEPSRCILIIYIYFSKYSFFSLIKTEIFIICITSYFALLLYFFYKVIFLRRLKIYCKKIEYISQKCYIYVYNVDTDFKGELFRYFLKPCVMQMHINPVLDGYVLSRNQYEYCKEHITDHVCVGIDCYNKFVSSKTNFYCDEFMYSVAIREQQILKSDEALSLSVLNSTYFNVLTLKSFKQLKYSAEVNDFFKKMKIDVQYLYTMKMARRSLSNVKQITNIMQFDTYLVSVLDKVECELDRYTTFNTILKGYEAIIHYICVYNLISLDIKLEDAWDDFKIVEEVEKGSLGAWLQMVYRVLKVKACYSGNWLSNKVSVDIAELFIKINYPSGVDLKCNKLNSKETYYHFLSNRLVNLRNNTIGHGSSAYIPTDKELLCMYKIYMYLFIEVSRNYNQLLQKEDTVWMTYLDKNVVFLDKLTLENNELRYLDYLSETSISMLWERRSH